MHPGLGPVPKYLPQLSEEETRTTVSRKPSTALFVISSADRPYVVGNTGAPIPIIPSSWSDFRVQKREALLQSFARRIQPVEIRFPWYIPNIVSSTRGSSNNTLYISVSTLSTPGVFYPISIPMGYYSPADLVLALNLALAAFYTSKGLVVSPPTISYSGFKYTITNPSTGAAGILFNFEYVPPQTSTYVDRFKSQASLWKTMGFTAYQGLNVLTPTQTQTGLVTLTAYTDYVDITSSKLNLYSDVKDGSSAEGGTDPVICRLFGNNEISYNPDQAWTPFVIHRQFPLPKTIQWNPESTIDWFDIQVRDMYGLPVPTPAYTPSTGSASIDSSSYPDFQITFQASEN